MTHHIFIDGAAGTTGLEIRERLDGRDEFTLVTLDDAQRKDPQARRAALNDADVVILCLPDDAAREAVSMIDNDRTVVIDASTAHRTAPGWTYGLPELSGRDAITAARRISNPGCYPTGFIALVAPLVRAGIVPGDWPLSVNAVSGYSGGGKGMIAEFEQGTPPTAWRTYGLNLAHKHVPEMMTHSGLSVAPIFAPSVANMLRGMIVEVPLPIGSLPTSPDPAVILDAWEQAYAGSSIIRVVTGYNDATLPIERVSGFDHMELFLFANAEQGQARLVAALDNLGKGASGAAVQNLNIVAGLAEETGLNLPA